MRLPEDGLADTAFGQPRLLFSQSRLDHLGKEGRHSLRAKKLRTRNNPFELQGHKFRINRPVSRRRRLTNGAVLFLRPLLCADHAAPSNALLTHDIRADLSLLRRRFGNINCIVIEAVPGAMTLITKGGAT